MKKIYTLIIMTLLALTINASKVVTRTFQVTLADGRTVTAQTRGDENWHYIISDTNEMLVKENGVWRVATEEESLQNFQKAQISLAKSQIIASNPFPHLGTPKVLVIMTNFTDATFQFTKDDIDKLLNSTKYDNSKGKHGYSSAAQFFNDCSNGKFHPLFDVVGPYNLAHDTKYYGDGNDNIISLVTDACKAAHADGVDFSQYDSDNDGKVDLVYIFYAGYGENWDDGTHPEYLYPKSGVSKYLGSYDGKQIYRYAIDAELTGYPGVGTYLNGIGVFVHEMTHTMGLPDFYPSPNLWTDITKYDNQSMEEWDLMDGGENIENGYYPTPYSAFEREFFEWETIDTLSESSNVTLLPFTKGGKALKIINENDPSKNEYYILENIPSGSASGWYRYMPGVGLLVTHINYSESAFSNFSYPNNEWGKPRITLIPADDNMYTSYRCSQNTSSIYYLRDDDYKLDLRGDTYPGICDVTKVTDWKAYTGTVDKTITDIDYTNGMVTFKFTEENSPTSIMNKNVTTQTENNNIYSLDGINLGTNSYNLKNGLYIKNGKKFVK